MKKGIDVSKYQQNIDWKKVKESGIEFAIIRIGYGKFDNQKDEYFEKNYEGAKKVGIPLGVYHYSYAKNINDARMEAACVIKWLKKRKLDLPVYFDIEDNSQASLDKKLLNEICKAFCNQIEANGYWAGIYSNKHWATNIIDGKILGKRYTYWIAQYNKNCTYDGPYDIWQYSSSGKVNGINGNVDMNYMYKDLVSEIKEIKKTQTSIKKSNEEIANEVINGKWGNGNDRKGLLINSGYDYNVIQKIVNKKLNSVKNTIYIVKKGDTLSSIAKKYNTSWKKIYEDNKSIIGSNPNLIFPGQKLIIK